MRAKKSIRAWVAREKNGALFLFCEKPKKSKSYWINSNTFNSLVLPKEAFPNVKWEITNLLEYISEQHSMTIRRSYSNSILTSISEFLIALIIILIATVSISKYCTDYDYYNYVELKAQYKNYIVTNKYVRNSDTYVLELMNPFSKKTKEVYVRDYLYYNTYFVGDTIK